MLHVHMLGKLGSTQARGVPYDVCIIVDVQFY